MRKLLKMLVGLVMLVGQAAAQQIPQGYFRNPMDFDIALSATFAEFRTGHFHAGLDMRTGGVVDKPVYAVADGYVAKVSISPWGGGKILYIKHPNGYTSVYMHLNGYAGDIGKAVLKEQYTQQKYSITKLFPADALPVKKGQVVAYSGNTGGSGGPHLHFELRRGGAADLHTHSTTINPLLFGLPYRDNIKPTIQGVRVYPTDGMPFDVKADNKVNIAGPFYLGIYATDAAEGSTAKNGVDRVEVYLDGTLAFMYTTEELPVDSSRMVNALIDYPLFINTKQPYLLTRVLPGAEGPWIPIRMGDGIFRLKPGTTHNIGIKVYDIRDNCAERTITIQSSPTCQTGQTSQTSRTCRTCRTGQTFPVKYDQPFEHKAASFTFHLAPFTLYADDRMDIVASGQTVKIMPTVNDIPPHINYTLSIKGSLTGVPAGKTIVARMIRKPGSVKLSAYSTTHADGTHTAQVRDWGEFTLAADTTAPTIRPVNFSEGKPLKATTLKIKIGDNLSGIETYSCRLNGNWILAEYDGKTAMLIINAVGKLKAGRNTLTCEVTDAVGNRTRRQWVVGS